jgi:hypothetical protein
MGYRQGNTGRSARHYGDEMSVLYGRLTTGENAVYPDDDCLQCVREGKTDEQCFHNHWETTDQERPHERRA